MVTVGNNEKPSKIMTYLYVTLCLTETMFILFIYGSICKRFITAVSVWMLTGIWTNLKLLMEQSAHPLNSHLAMQETSNQQNIHSKFKLSLRQIISTLALISMSLHFQKFLDLSDVIWMFYFVTIHWAKHLWLGPFSVWILYFSKKINN